MLTQQEKVPHRMMLQAKIANAVKLESLVRNKPLYELDYQFASAADRSIPLEPTSR
jgi:hypothetical protein